MGSVGAWLQKNVTPTAIALYVGAILIHEGNATRMDRIASVSRSVSCVSTPPAGNWFFSSINSFALNVTSHSSRNFLIWLYVYRALNGGLSASFFCMNFLKSAWYLCSSEKYWSTRSSTLPLSPSEREYVNAINCQIAEILEEGGQIRSRLLDAASFYHSYILSV
jgi:hypothetical protein